MKQINAVLFGVGAMGKPMTRYLCEKGINIMGAFSRRSHIGEDLGVVAGLDKPLGININSSPDELLARGNIDVAIVATCSDMQSFYPVAEVCAKNKVNVLTITEEAFFPWQLSPKLASKLDNLARDNGVSISATGVQDVFWLNLPLVLTGASQSIESILGTARVNLDYYGPALLSQYPLDLSNEEYLAAAGEQDEGAILPIFGIALEALVANLGFTVKNRNVMHEPLFDTVDIRSDSLDKVIGKGRTCGVKEIYEMETEESVSLRVEFIEKLCRPDEKQIIGWDIKGTPDINLMIDDLAGEVVTCSTTVNRIPDIINAKPGYINTGDLSRITFRTNPVSV